MKTIFLTLALLFSSTSFSAPAKVLSAKEATTLLFRSAGQVQVANENPYERYDETVAELLSNTILSSFEQPSVASAECKIVSGRETCYFNVHHVDDPSTEEAEEWSIQFQFEIDRSKSAPSIKNNQVRVMMAG